MSSTGLLQKWTSCLKIIDMEDVSRPETRMKYRGLIIALSILIPVIVALLFGMRKIEGYDLTFLPPVYATVNGLTAILLIVAVSAIKRGNRTLHELLMKVCIGLSAAFLIMYVAYHTTTASTTFGGTGTIKYVYYFILITHILLSICVVPFVLFTFAQALSGNFVKHRKIARYTFPLWLYVAITGVIVYLMISPYYK
jgi:putative membrane protein